MPWFVTAIFVGAGAVLMGVAVPLVRGRVPPNAWYGVRLPATLADERVWYAVNARSGRDLFVLGAALAAAAVAAPALMPGWPAPRRALALVGALLVGAALLAIRAALHGARLRQEYGESPGPHPQAT